MALYVTRTGVTLAVGIIILSLVALGALYVVREQGEQARRDAAIAVAEEEVRNNGEVAIDGTPSVDGDVEDSGEAAGGDSANDLSDEVSGAGGVASSENTPGDTSAPAADDGVNGARDNAEGGGRSSTATSGTSTTEGAVDALPQTGPAANLLAVALLGIGVYSATLALRCVGFRS